MKRLTNITAAVLVLGLVLVHATESFGAKKKGRGLFQSRGNQTSNSGNQGSLMQNFSRKSTNNNTNNNRGNNGTFGQLNVQPLNRNGSNSGGRSLKSNPLGIGNGSNFPNGINLNRNNNTATPNGGNSGMQNGLRNRLQKITGNNNGGLTNRILNNNNNNNSTNLGNLNRNSNKSRLAELTSKFTGGKDSLVPLKDLAKSKGLKSLINNGQLQANLGVQQQQAKKICENKIKTFCGNNHKCNWWANFVIGTHCHHNHHWWNYCHDPSYWSCWRPCHWHVVHCVDSTRWYLGVNGTIIPGTGFGVNAVTAYSPAAQAGLLPGHIVLSVNGQPLVSEAVLAESIQNSLGTLVMEVIGEGSDQPYLTTVYLQRVYSHSY